MRKCSLFEICITISRGRSFNSVNAPYFGLFLFRHVSCHMPEHPSDINYCRFKLKFYNLLEFAPIESCHVQNQAHEK